MKTTEELQADTDKLQTEIADLERRLEAFDKAEVGKHNTLRQTLEGRLAEAQGELERASFLLRESKGLDDAEKRMAEGPARFRDAAATDSLRLKYQRMKRNADSKPKPQSIDFSSVLETDRELLTKGETNAEESG